MGVSRGSWPSDVVNDWKMVQGRFWGWCSDGTTLAAGRVMAAMNLSQPAGSSGGGDSGSVGAGGGKDDRIEQQYQYHTSRAADGKQEATNTAGMPPRDSIWAVEPVPEHEQLVVRVAPGLVALYLPRTRQATTLPSL